MFQKRHMEAIAEVMQATFPAHANDSERRVQWYATRNALVGMFLGSKTGNPLFDVGRFERACEPGANVRKRSA